MGRPAVLLALVVVAAVGVRAQQVFRAGRTTVAVPVTVIDGDGRVITTLERDDFRLFDNDSPQEISNFISGEEPLTAVVLIDTSASMTVGLEFAQFAAEQFIIRMRPGDRARVGSFSDRLTLSGVFTQDRDALLRAVREDLRIGNPTRLLDAVDNAISTLTAEVGRRVIVLLSDGCDTASSTPWSELLGRIRTEDVMLYAMQVRSRIRVLPENRSRRGWDCVRLEHQFINPEPIESIRDVFDSNRPTPDLLLDRLTIETGGSRVLLNPDDRVNATFTGLMQELHHQYLLGFQPQKLDGKVHELRVDVRDRTLAARARRSYLAAPPDPAGGSGGRPPG